MPHLNFYHKVCMFRNCLDISRRFPNKSLFFLNSFKFLDTLSKVVGNGDTWDRFEPRTKISRKESLKDFEF